MAQKRGCEFTECDRPHKAKNLCERHYNQKRATGRLAPIRQVSRPGDSVQTRLDSRTNKSGRCWLWQGHLSKGYGYLKLDRRNVAVHRLVYEIHFGPIPDGTAVDHACRERACVRPQHLRLATTKQNAENTGSRSGSATGVRGVTVERGRYRVHVMHHGSAYFGGRFDNLREAELSEISLRDRLFTHNVERTA